MTDKAWNILMETGRTGEAWYNLKDGETERILKALTAFGYIKVCADGTAYMENSGYAALETHQQELDNKRKQEAANRAAKEEDRAYSAANDRKQRHHDYLVAAFQLIIPWILGLVAEYYFQIIAFVVHLFE